jgi:hypothetical protein
LDTHYYYTRLGPYGGGPAQGFDKLNPHVISTWSQRKKTLE